MRHRDAPGGMDYSRAGNPANSGSACPEQDQAALDARKMRAWGCSVMGSSRVPAGAVTKADFRSNLGTEPPHSRQKRLAKRAAPGILYTPIRVGPVGRCYLAPVVPGRYVLLFIHPRPFVVPDRGRYSAPT